MVKLGFHQAIDSDAPPHSSRWTGSEMGWWRHIVPDASAAPRKDGVTMSASSASSASLALRHTCTMQGNCEQFSPQCAPHLLKRPPQTIEDAEGRSYLLFECLRCGCDVGIELDVEECCEQMVLLPPTMKLS